MSGVTKADGLWKGCETRSTPGVVPRRTSGALCLTHRTATTRHKTCQGPGFGTRVSAVDVDERSQTTQRVPG